MTDELGQQLQASLGTAYTVERELGGGGMSRVFLAHELRFNRRVVVKLLSPVLAAGISADRFEREITLAARLQQANIVPVIAAGDADGLPWYTMPFVEGESLRARMTCGSVAPAEAMHILADVARALAYAHAHGVIHRDIKPENVLLSGGAAVVTDFGIARALSRSKTYDTAATLTGVGTSLGTPAYMAPEQAAGERVDHRADIYAWGVIAYELLGGRHPFGDKTAPQQLIAAHIAEVPRPLDKSVGSIRPLVRRCLEKDPSRRPGSADELLRELEPAIFSTGAPRTRRVPLLTAAGVIAVAVIGGVFWMRRPAVASRAESIAVAPFVAADGDSSLTRLGKDLVTTISTNLDGVGELQVADPVAMLGRAASVGHLLSAADAVAAARSLGARSVVRGTLTPVGTLVRADLTLVPTDGSSDVLARVSATAPADSVVTMSDSLTWGLLRQVWQRGQPPTPTFATVRTHSFTALREFLTGEDLFARGDMPAAIEAYERAVAADTAFWFARYKLRVARGWIGERLDRVNRAKLMAHLQDLAPRDREFIVADTGTIQRSTVELRRFLQQYPDFAPAWQILGDHLIHQRPMQGSDIHDAIYPLQRAMQLMPNDQTVVDHLLIACSLAADADCTESAWLRLDSLSRNARLGAEPRLVHYMFAAGLGQPAGQSVDSIAVVGIVIDRQVMQGVLETRPEAQHDLDLAEARLEARTPRAARQSLHVAEAIQDRLVRGAWQAALDTVANAAPSLRLTPDDRVGILRVRAIGEAVGALAANRSTADSGRVIAASGDPAASLSAQWVIGLNSLLRGDSAAYREVMRRLAADTAVRAQEQLRSLRGLSLGFAGKHIAAAESLYAVDGPDRDHVGDLGAQAADHLFGARWLQDAHQPMRADSLLRFASSWYFSSAMVPPVRAVVALALLERSRIAETLGRREDAIRFARRFVAMYDMPPPAHRPLIQEAKERIARLTKAEPVGR